MGIISWKILSLRTILSQTALFFWWKGDQFREGPIAFAYYGIALACCIALFTIFYEKYIAEAQILFCFTFSIFGKIIVLKWRKFSRTSCLF